MMNESAHDVTAGHQRDIIAIIKVASAPILTMGVTRRDTNDT